MANFKVVGVTKKNENNEDIQEVLNNIIEGYVNEGILRPWEDFEQEGYELEGQTLNGVIHLEREPNNPYDPNAIKVYMQDVKRVKHHVGYIPREHTEKAAEIITKRIDAEFTGRKYKLIEDGEIHTENITTGLVIDLIELGGRIAESGFFQSGLKKESKAEKIIKRISLFVIAFSILIIILISLL